MARTNPAYTLANVDLASLDVSLSDYREQEAVTLVERIQERVAGINGVTSVATARMIPLQGSSLGLGRIRVGGYQDARGDNLALVTVALSLAMSRCSVDKEAGWVTD